MPHSDRVGIAMGLNLFLIGLAITYLLPFTAFILIGPAFDISSSNQDDMFKSFAVHARSPGIFASFVGVMKVCGLAIAAGGFLMAYLTWMFWFIRPEASATPNVTLNSEHESKLTETAAPQ